MDAGAAGTVVIGTHQRTVMRFDLRKWKWQQKWINALKFEVKDVRVSPRDADRVFVVGVDSEITSAALRDIKAVRQKKPLFHADGHWLGFDVLTDSDTAAAPVVGFGLSATANLWQMRNMDRMPLTTRIGHEDDADAGDEEVG